MHNDINYCRLIISRSTAKKNISMMYDYLLTTQEDVKRLRNNYQCRAYAAAKKLCSDMGIDGDTRQCAMSEAHKQARVKFDAVNQ